MSQGRCAWITVIPPAAAEGELADVYREIQPVSGGEPAHILQAQSVVQSVAYFSFVNRLAAGLGVELEE